MKSKLPHAAPASDLYTSALFRGRRRYVERTCDRWYVLSALHGLLRADEIVEPYDLALKDSNVGERREWASRVLGALEDELGDLGEHTFEIHAGAPYRDHGLVAGLRVRGALVENPTEGLSQGRQLAFYA